MTNNSFKLALGAPGVLTPEPVKSHRGDRFSAMAHGLTALLTAEGEAEGKTPDPAVPRTANLGFDAVAFSLSGIWDASTDLSGHAWDAINDLLAVVGGGGGGGARKLVSSDEAEIVTTTRAPALFGP
ncbi:hypothetical protein J2X01_001723 [Arthrobacter ginsengisoli]|uniref:Uncharacterized protein n=1 Tax=Arthrobacter ginsengisoli TaxID=1356565 RepID=A0ABU1UB58_9MICC|nr:hypothetical protein [Arthrobacter ginsengisoli]MDR7082434.1 hypothetical protein [Arthrobacter ginsengisoli]